MISLLTNIYATSKASSATDDGVHFFLCLYTRTRVCFFVFTFDVFFRFAIPDAGSIEPSKALPAQYTYSRADYGVGNSAGLCKGQGGLHGTGAVDCHRARIVSIRLRFTPKSERPTRDADRTWMTLAASSARNSTSSTNRKMRLVNSTCR
jgi:hypothetical protein